MNVKASSVSEIIVWVSIVTSAVVGAAWFLTVFSSSGGSVGAVENDLSKLQLLVNEACFAKEYAYTFNPSTEDGNLTLSTKRACIYNTKIELCRDFLCDKIESTTLNLKDLDKILITKNVAGKVIISAK